MQENIVNAYHARQQADNRGKWAQDNEQADQLLNAIEVMLYDAD